MPIEIVQVSGLPAWVPEALAADFTIHNLIGHPDPAALTAEIAPRVRGMLASAQRGPDAAMLDRFPKLEVISSFGVGVDSIDVGAAKARGIAVANTPDVLTDCVADMAVCLMFDALRRVAEGDRFVRSGRWPAEGSMRFGRKIGGARLGIVGFGRIGQGIAQRAAAFGMKVAYTGPRKKADQPYAYYPTPLALAAESDVLMLSCPGGPATEKMIGKEVLDALGPEGWLVNISRGSVVDEAALIAALRENRIAGAALDVFVNEPNIDPAFLTLENAVLCPHAGSATYETRKAMGQLTIDNLRSWFANGKVITPLP